MSYHDGILVRVFPKSESIIAKVGNVLLKEKTWGIEIALDRDPSTKNLKIAQTTLLSPHTTSDYITIKEAVRETDLSYSQIRDLVNRDSVDAIKIGRKWLILRDSLKNYIRHSNSAKKYK